MATCYGGLGDTSRNNPESEAMDADIQDNYQEDINDLENIEPEPQAGLKPLTLKIEQLWQTIEANDNDPMDAMSLGIKTQPVSYHTLHTNTYRTHWGSSKQIHKYFMWYSEENISWKLIVTGYHSTEWKWLFPIRRLVNRYWNCFGFNRQKQD